MSYYVVEKHKVDNQYLFELPKGRYKYLDLIFDDLIKCASTLGDWSGPLSRLSDLIGADNFSFSVSAPDSAVPHMQRAIGHPRLNPLCQPTCFEIAYDGVTMSLYFYFLDTECASGKVGTNVTQSIERHLYRCLVVAIWRWKAVDAKFQVSALVDAMTNPCILLNGDDRVVAANVAARHIFGFGPSEPWIDGPSWRDAWNRAGEAGDLETTLDIGGRKLHLKRITLDIDPSGKSHQTQPYSLIEVRIADPTLLDAVNLVGSKFALSTTETRILGHIVDGNDVDQTAIVRGVSRETVRTQLRSCRAKTSTNSQFQLVSLVHQTLAQLRKASNDQLDVRHMHRTNINARPLEVANE